MSNNPFKTVTVEYFEYFDTEDKKIVTDLNLIRRDNRNVIRRIKVVTTIRDYNVVSSKGDPIISVTYEYL